MAFDIDEKRVPLREVSGLTVHRARTGAGHELVCVGDRQHRLLCVPVDDAGGLGEGEVVRLRPLLEAADVPVADDSDFEAVASDGHGRLLLLEEGRSRVLVVDPSRSRLEAVIAMDVAPGQPGFGARWAQDANARAEGLLPMAGGHLLLVTQKPPIHLVELGPAGDDPLGVRRSTLLPDDAAFSIPEGQGCARVAYSVLAWWELAAGDGDPVGSANDLAQDDEGRVHILSSESGRIVRIEDVLDAGAHEARIAGDWCPPLRGLSGDRRPEGLAFLRGACIVGIDTHGSGVNLMVLSR